MGASIWKHLAKEIYTSKVNTVKIIVKICGDSYRPKIIHPAVIWSKSIKSEISGVNFASKHASAVKGKFYSAVWKQLLPFSNHTLAVS